MRAAAMSLLLALAWSAPAAAQPEAPPPAPRSDADDGSSIDEAPAGEPASTEPASAGTTSTDPASTDPASTEPSSTDPASTEPSSTGTTRTEPTSAASSAPVVVVHHREEAEEEPTRDGDDPYDILWIELFGGGSYVDLRAIDTTNYYPEIVRLSGWGPAGGAALGFRIEFVSVGVRAALAHYDLSDAAAPDAVFDVGTLAAEVKLALPLPVVKPFLRAGFGFAWHGDSNAEDAWSSGMVPDDIQTTVYGWVFQGAVGVDIYLADWFAVGAAFALDVLNMSRQPIQSATDVSFRESGDAVGAQGRGQLSVSVHL